jgi:hypothetical protein
MNQLTCGVISSVSGYDVSLVPKVVLFNPTQHYAWPGQLCPARVFGGGVSLKMTISALCFIEEHSHHRSQS